jgi:hypothetical protein
VSRRLVTPAWSVCLHCPPHPVTGTSSVAHTFSGCGHRSTSLTRSHPQLFRDALATIVPTKLSWVLPQGHAYQRNGSMAEVQPLAPVEGNRFSVSQLSWDQVYYFCSIYCSPYCHCNFSNGSVGLGRPTCASVNSETPCSQCGMAVDMFLQAFCLCLGGFLHYLTQLNIC